MNIALFEPHSLSPISKPLAYLRRGVSNYRTIRGKPNVLANITFRSTACNFFMINNEKQLDRRLALYSSLSRSITINLI